MAQVMAGVGGISGGSTSYQRGSHILFQKESTYVSVIHSKTLCHNGQDFRASIKKCLDYDLSDKGKCLFYETKLAYQPIRSTKSLCVEQEDSNCITSKEVPFYQSPKKIVDIYGSGDSLKSKKKINVPICD